MVVRIIGSLIQPCLRASDFRHGTTTQKIKRVSREDIRRLHGDLTKPMTIQGKFEFLHFVCTRIIRKYDILSCFK